MKITYKNKEYEYKNNTSLLEISKDFSNNYKFDILLGKVNNEVVELDYNVNMDCEIDFYDLTHHIGNKSYERGLVFLVISAFRELYNCDIKIGHSIDKGIFCEVINFTIDENKLNNIKNKIKEYVSSNIKFEKVHYTRYSMEEYYKNNKIFDKLKNLKYVVRNSLLLYKFNNNYDYFYGEMPINSSYIKYFDFHFFNEKSFILLLPNIYLEGSIKPYEHYEKVFNAFKSFTDFSKSQNIFNVSDLNENISSNKIGELIYINESYQNKILYDVVDEILVNNNIKIILIGGPSSSGKTTMSKKLSMFLKSFGLEPKYLSIDDFFKERDETPIKENGKLDFESLNSVDLELFNSSLEKLLNQEEVVLPVFNFIKGTKEYNRKLKLNNKSILIIEGLHALDDNLLSKIDNSSKFKIYVSPLSSINIDNHNRITTSDIRLFRRIIRDNMTRGYSASDTLEAWKEVRGGEELYVFPFQNKCDVVINTSLVYELGVFRTFVEPLLFSINSNDKNYDEAIRLINLIRNILPIAQNELPYDSIIREFIGNSFFSKIGDE